MPRPIVLSNGSLYLGFDDRGCVRDLFWPQVGFPNHLNGRRMRWGVWKDDRFAWCDDPSWQIDYEFVHHETSPVQLISNLVNRELGLKLGVMWLIDPNLPRVMGRLCTESDCQIFATHPFCLNESDIGDTAFYDPSLNAVVHYKGSTAIGCSLINEHGDQIEFSCGTKEFGNLEGTFRDAEDGHLRGKAIEQGSVDSTISVASLGKCVFWQIQCADSVETLRKSWLKADHENFTREAERFEAAVPQEAQIHLDFIRANIDNEGAILAATDSDILATARATYCYCWPRDGALVAEVLTEVGDFDKVDRFFDFCLRVMPSNPPVFLQKYNPDGTLGASWHPWIWEGESITPFQQDETALIISAIAHRVKNGPKLNNFSQLFSKIIEPACDFFLDYRDEQGLPKPSWDLWEERRGVHFFTTCAVIRSLRDASNLEGGKSIWKQESDSIRLDRFIQNNRYTRMLGDETPDASILAGMLLLPELLETETGINTLRWIKDELDARSPVGGCARYAGDYYFRQTDAYPGNPWIISTMWLAQAEILHRDRSSAKSRLKWVRKIGYDIGRTGALPEQVHPETGAHLSVSPLTWSHAEVLRTILMLEQTA